MSAAIDSTFKRMQTEPVLHLLIAIIFGFTCISQMKSNSTVGILTGLTSILFISNFIWAVNTPFIIIKYGIMRINNTVLNHREVTLTDIERIEIKGLKHINIYRKDGTRVGIMLSSMVKYQREEFINFIKTLTY